MLNDVYENLDLRDIDKSVGINSGIIGSPNYSGTSITEQTAIGLSALWCGIRVIAEDIASLPLVLYRLDNEDHATKAKSHSLYRLLNAQPNPEMTRPVFWETMVVNMVLYGNAYAEIVRSGDGKPQELWPVHPLYVNVYRDPDTGTLSYKDTRVMTGGPPGYGSPTKEGEDVLHIPGLSLQGSVGMGLLYTARQTLGWGLGAQRYGCSLWRNVAKPAGIIKETIAPIQTSPLAEENMKRSWQQDHSKDDVGRVGFLRYGYDFSQLDLTNNEQLEFTQLLQFYNSEIARFLRLNPTKLMDMGRATWGNLTEVNRDHWGTSIKPWADKIEAEAERKLLLPDEQDQYRIRFDTSDLLRADMTTRYQAYSVALASGWLDKYEVRAQENLPPMKSQEEPTDDQGDDNQAQPIQDTALSGIQVTSLLTITDKVRTGDYSPEAGTALIKACFPEMSDTLIKTMIDVLAKQSEEEPELAEQPPEAKPNEDSEEASLETNQEESPKDEQTS